MSLFIKAAEGFDVYPAGIIGTSDYPWTVTDATKAGVVTASAGVFGDNSLAFAGAGSSSSTGFEYAFPSTLTPNRTNTAAGFKGILAFRFWFKATNMVNATNTLLALGTSANSSQKYDIFGFKNTSGAGPQLTFPSSINNLTASPYTYPIVASEWYWVDIRLAFYATGQVFASYRVNDADVVSPRLVSWTSDAFTSGNVADRLKFYISSNIDYMLDDLVISAVSSADADWPVVGAGDPVIGDMPTMSARRIYNGTAVSDGTTNDWSTFDAGATPNYQAATDTSGDEYVIANAVNQLDLYKWEVDPGATDIAALVYRGMSAKYSSIQPVQLVGATETDLLVSSGSAKFIGITEDDGADPWTVASLEAAEFGQKVI